MDIDSLKRKAERGNCAAQTILGISYLYGEDVDLDYEEAFRLLSTAASAGASRAVLNLANMYAQGLGTSQNMPKAIELYESVGGVEFLAAIALGRIYSMGSIDSEGVAPDEQRARHWYSVAASFEGRVNCVEEMQEARDYVSGATDLGLDGELS